VIDAVPAGIPVILDAKRGDIASTAEAYARSAFEKCWARTPSPSTPTWAATRWSRLSRIRSAAASCCAKPPTPAPATCKTWRIQEQGQLLYEKVARLAESWNHNDNVGLVVGATHPEALRRCARPRPELWILAPGVGAQGGDLRAALQAGLRADGLGMLFLSRAAVARATDPLPGRTRAKYSHPAGTRADSALPATSAQNWRRACCSRLRALWRIHPQIWPEIADLPGPAPAGQPSRRCWPRWRAYLPLLQGLTFDRLAALPYAALPIGTAVSLQGGWPMIYPRKEAKEYGTRAEIEGEYHPGEPWWSSTTWPPPAAASLRPSKS
jgi:uridine monophosphate synthetase